MKTFKENNNIIWRKCSRSEAIKAFNSNERIYINQKHHFKKYSDKYSFNDFEKMALKKLDKLEFYKMEKFNLKISAPIFFVWLCRWMRLCNSRSTKNIHQQYIIRSCKK